MQTLTLKVQDDFLTDVVNLLTERFRGSVEILRDKNLARDPYFYERRKHLHALREEVRNGKAEMLTEEEFQREAEAFMNILKHKYADQTTR